MASNNGSQLLSVGKQCSHPSCLLIDFLPFTCQHCKEPFCQEHFRVSAHSCSKYDESKYNRVAPDCPLCNTPVAVRPGQDPNDRMEEHFFKECSVMTGKSGKTSTTPICARGNCKKVLFQPIRCDKCRKEYCASHRFPSDHNCTPIPAPSTSRPTVSNPFNNVNARNLNNKATAAGAATMDAVKKVAASAKVASQNLKPTSTSSASTPVDNKSKAPSSHINPFSKTDRRAKAERESKIKAMQARAKKGLLSEEEKATLAAEEKAVKKDDCIVM